MKCQLLCEQQLWRQLPLRFQTCQLPLLAAIFRFGIFPFLNLAHPWAILLRSRVHLLQRPRHLLHQMRKRNGNRLSKSSRND